MTSIFNDPFFRLSPEEKGKAIVEIGKIFHKEMQKWDKPASESHFVSNARGPVSTDSPLDPSISGK